MIDDMINVCEDDCGRRQGRGACRALPHHQAAGAWRHGVCLQLVKRNFIQQRKETYDY